MTDTSTEEPTPASDHPGQDQYAESPRAFPDEGSADPFGEPLAPEPGGASAGLGRAAADPGFSTGVRGRIKVADEVVEKVAALAALEITGVADLGGDFERALESVRDRIGVGSKRAGQGVSARIDDEQATVAVDVTIVIEYGHIVMEVAGDVKANVARTVSHMLGMRVVEVNVTVDDVRIAGDDRSAEAGGEHAA
ncbi:Asp23/Gls24 family envelope stress response protein [Sphaerisporangium corydalis]|uniref:Asp23/Gls24 family envelope stress response protein n=1 Tax=Sphaerisporangium corydalis TaxID=1441875 RepID=A0ABV9E6J6_9ACTN|nr:Asp23/Gls24 family envelope stress response protein [Sphaerisporangium corydalis]